MSGKEKRAAAKQDYESGMKYKDIANKYGVSLNTVKSWKSRYKWQRAPNQKGVHTKVKKGAHKTKSYATIEELNNSDLNEKQKAFVLEYLRLLNATQAYINVYGVGYNTAKTAGPRMLGNVGVQKEIKRVRGARLQELAVEPLELIADLAKEARADIGDFVDFGSWPELLAKRKKVKKKFKDKAGHELSAEVVEQQPILDANGNKVIIHHNYVHFKDKSKVDTSLIKSVKMGKDGPVIELYDKAKARDKLLEWLQDSETDGTESVHIQIDVPKSRKEKADNDKHPDE